MAPFVQARANPNITSSTGGLGIYPPLYVLVFGALHGTTIALGKVVGGMGVSPAQLAFVQMAGAGTLLLLLATLRRQAVALSAHHVRYYLISGLMGNAIPVTLTFYCAGQIGAGLTGVVYSLSPMFTYLMAMVFGKQPGERRRFFGLSLGLVGALCIVAPQLIDAENPLHALPLGWLFASFLIPVFLAAGNIYRSADWPPDTASIPLAAGMLLATALWLIPAVLLLPGGGASLNGINIDTAIAPVAFVVLISFVSFILYFELQRLAGPVYFSQVSYSIALTSMAIGVGVLGEPPRPEGALAIVLIFSGLFFVTRTKKQA